MHCPTSEDVRAWTESALAYAKPAFHWGFIPLIIVLGMQTDPKPSLAQLLGPM